jgi:hypothetical protein
VRCLEARNVWNLSELEENGLSVLPTVVKTSYRGNVVLLSFQPPLVLIVVLKRLLNQLQRKYSTFFLQKL